MPFADKEFMQLIVGAMTLSASLAWNDAFRSFFDNTPYLKKYGPWIYALCVTIAVYILIKMLQTLKNKNILEILTTTPKKYKK